MAFYQDAPKKGRVKKEFGNSSWEEEGSRYTKEDRTADGGAFSSASGKKQKPGTGFKRTIKNNRSAEKRSDDRTGFKAEGTYGYSQKTGSRNSRQRPEMPDKQGTGKSFRSIPHSEARRSEPQNNRLRSERISDDTENRMYSERDKAALRVEPIENEDYILCGRNPIREALRNGRDIDRLLVQKGELNSSAAEIIREAREKKILIREVDKHRLDEIAPHHQGLVAYAAPYKYADLDELMQIAAEKNEDPFLILLDGITDPHNLGAIIRTAECVGAHGVIIPEHRSVGLSPAAIKASAGAVEHLRIARVTNLNRAIDQLKASGVWTYALTMNGRDYEDTDFRGGVALVIGAEGDGISRLTEEKCDMSVSLPLRGKIDSLNASVAAGIVMYRVLACRRKKG